MTATRYYQLLTALLDRPEAAEVARDPVGELRALRDQRRRYRAHPTPAAPHHARVALATITAPTGSPSRALQARSRAS